MNSPAKRHWVYGLNFAVLIIVAAVILGFLLYLTEIHNRHVDMTGGLYSLSPATKKLLEDIGQKKQNYHFISQFPDVPVQGQENKRQRVADLLGEYARNSSFITVEDGSEYTTDEVVKRVKPLYATEIKAYEDAIAEFDGVAEEFKAFCAEEAANIGAVAQKPGTPKNVVQEAAALQGMFGNGFPNAMEETRRMVSQRMDSAFPAWATVVSTIRAVIKEIQPNLVVLAEPKFAAQQVPGMASYLTANTARYRKMFDRLNAYDEKLGKLPPLKVQQVIDSFTENSILIVGPNGAKVVPAEDIYPYVPRQNPNDKTIDFKGESAVSSALLGLVRVERSKVVFISPFQQRLLTTQFAQVARKLQDNNFDALEWAPPGPPTGPDSPPQEPNPPAEGKGVVWVVFPPGQFSRVPGAGRIGELVKHHLAAGGRVMFLAEASMEGMGATYPYEEITRQFGIDVQNRYTIVTLQEGSDPETGEQMRQTAPVVRVKRFPQHQITRYLQAMPTAFVPMQSQMGYVGLPTVVRKAEKIPPGVEADIFVESPELPECWATLQFSTEANYDSKVDLAGPCPMAVAAIKDRGQPGEQRVIAIGSNVFAADASQIIRRVQIGNSIRRINMLPGNQELFLNCVLWLGGYENMIAVSSQADVAERIGDVTPSAMQWIRWGVLFIGAPVLAMVIGGVVWFIRRK